MSYYPCSSVRIRPVNGKSNAASGLGDLEAAVMETLWLHGESSTPAVFELVGKPRGLAYTTILTILQRLHKKGLATRRLSGKVHVYAAALDREKFARQRGETLASTLVQLGSAGVTAFLAEAEKLDPSIVETLRKQLERQR